MAAMELKPGMRFGRLTIIEEAGLAKSGNMRWRCRCACGRETLVSGSVLRRGDTKSCGCLLREKRPGRKKKNFDGCQRTDCRYYNFECHCCNYFDIAGHTRTWLHLDEEGVDINNPCREYEPRPDGFNPRKAFRVNLY